MTVWTCIPDPPGRAFPPVSFSSTVAALMLASRGCLPMHGSAVALEGQATLICGPAGAGKLTLAARLLTQGATLISDDLSILYPGLAGGPPMLFAGRRAIRLYPAAARALGQAVPWQLPPHPAHGKVAAYPPQMPAETAIPLTRVILMGHTPGEVSISARASLLAAQLFRPLCLRKMAWHERRMAMLAMAARNLHVLGEPAL